MPCTRAQLQSCPTQMEEVTGCPYFLGKSGATRASQVLSQPSVPNHGFVIRESESAPGSLTLCIKTMDNITNFKIKQAGPQYFIKQGEVFSSINQLLSALTTSGFESQGRHLRLIPIDSRTCTPTFIANRGPARPGPSATPDRSATLPHRSSGLLSGSVPPPLPQTQRPNQRASPTPGSAPPPVPQTQRPTLGSRSSTLPVGTSLAAMAAAAPPAVPSTPRPGSGSPPVPSSPRPSDAASTLPRNRAAPDPYGQHVHHSGPTSGSPRASMGAPPPGATPPDGIVYGNAVTRSGVALPVATPPSAASPAFGGENVPYGQKVSRSAPVPANQEDDDLYEAVPNDGSRPKPLGRPHATLAPVRPDLDDYDDLDDYEYTNEELTLPPPNSFHAVIAIQEDEYSHLAQPGTFGQLQSDSTSNVQASPAVMVRMPEDNYVNAAAIQMQRTSLTP
ncbi:uncharacterized protein MONBRDRAFT_5414 [Monosiga brevicollis MX1]|uniref:SH2 domain-containing protein n=1 Tax=Monosiga brevicollis TaxID=81824 RepID=A9UQX2_MONBE|nr:uncharacterized protein MONBRDRAFT_5414 [Monosiga brevicollis MX1]EDQ93120.1 predicted protein [Monosiga brevicollis MX1]|eukprot:XP_001742882.1 hypothetical protein [Monosiga brevicollis MX1]